MIAFYIIWLMTSGVIMATSTGYKAMAAGIVCASFVVCLTKIYVWHLKDKADRL